MERFSKLIYNIFGVKLDNIALVIVGVIIIAVTVYLLAVLVYYLVNLNTFKKKLRNIEIEIKRNSGSTARHWEQVKRQLYHDLFLFRF